MLAKTALAPPSWLPSTTRHTGGKSSWWRGQRARLARKCHLQLDRDRIQERDQSAQNIGATAKQASSTIPGQRRRKLESRSHRARGASGQARLAETVLPRLERVVAQSQLDNGLGPRAQWQRPPLHHRQALRKAVLRGEQPTRRMNILGPVSHFLSRYCRQGDRGLPRSWRTLMGWRKTLPWPVEDVLGTP